jgi:hypothetical protein
LVVVFEGEVGKTHVNLGEAELLKELILVDPLQISDFD